MNLEELKKHIELSHENGALTSDAWTLIKECAKEYVNKVKDLSEAEVDFTTYVVAHDIGRFWWTFFKNENFDLNVELETMNTLASNAILRAWQWFNWEKQESPEKTEKAES